jgi:hypothetical protein
MKIEIIITTPAAMLVHSKISPSSQPLGIGIEDWKLETGNWKPGFAEAGYLLVAHATSFILYYY